MALEREALNHRIEDDLALRNRNWNQLDSHLGDNVSAHGIDAKANKQQESWRNADLKNGWETFDRNYTTAQFLKDDFGFVHIRGTIKNGVGTADTILFTLPVGYRPEKTELFTTISYSPLKITPIAITADGIVKILITDANTTWLVLNGIYFKAA